jgi:LEA14-like dessication related protein
MRAPIGIVRAATLLLATLLLSACASMPASDPLQVTVAGIESLAGEGMEIRLLVKLRVQNPNDTPIEFDGVSVNLDVMDRRFASGVSDETGTVPRFGEAIVAVPVTVSVLRMARQVMGMLDGKPVEKINYSMSGKLSGAGMSGTRRFSAKGEFELPRSTPVAAGTT